MEQRQRIQLTTATKFVLEQEELHQLYVYLALFQYSGLCVPDYHEAILIKKLQQDFKRYYVELQRLTESDPNNLTLNRLRAFVGHHHQKLVEIIKKEESYEL